MDKRDHEINRLNNSLLTVRENIHEQIIRLEISIKSLKAENTYNGDIKIKERKSFIQKLKNLEIDDVYEDNRSYLRHKNQLNN